MLTITGLPDLSQLAPGIDVEKLLELRNRAERREFRGWLRTIDTESDQQISQLCSGRTRTWALGFDLSRPGEMTETLRAV